MPNTRFFLMIAVAMIVMFGLMHLNTSAWDHIFSAKRAVFSALLLFELNHETPFCGCEISVSI
tara:strand:- start:139 stop:327 length:189 start_codon:yes stop_codon:yes gene_type:complete